MRRRHLRTGADAAAAEAPTYLYHDLTPRILATPRHTAYIKINEGCDHPCTFCVIPQLRGKFRSRRFESVIREAENLAAAGVREISLIGQDTTYYGEDLGLRDGLPTLLERLAQIEDLHWVRFLYCYPNRITDKLLETIAAHPRLAKYLDIPLQHASRSVLARMKRGSNADAFLKMLEKIRRAIPGVSIRTSFIVGFPGETEEDFTELCDFVRAAEFDWMGVFSYSDEDAARSYALEDKVGAATIERRRNKLMSIQKKISARKLRGKIGQRLHRHARRPVERYRFRLGRPPRRHGAGYRRQSLHHGFRGRKRCGSTPCSRHARDSRDHRRAALRFDRTRSRIRRAAFRRAACPAEWRASCHSERRRKSLPHSHHPLNICVCHPQPSRAFCGWL